MSPNGGGRGELRGLVQWVQPCTKAQAHGGQINFGVLTPHLTYMIQATKYLYIKSTTGYVPSSELGLYQPNPSLASECAPPGLPPVPGGGGGEGLGESQSQLRRLEKKLSTLPTLLPLFSGEGLQAVVPSSNNNNRKAAPASGQGGRPASPEAGIVNQGFHTEEAAEGHTGGVSDPAPALAVKSTGARPKHSRAASGPSNTGSLSVTGQGWGSVLSTLTETA
jgi:hypothetical protein